MSLFCSWLFFFYTFITWHYCCRVDWSGNENINVILCPTLNHLWKVSNKSDWWRNLITWPNTTLLQLFRFASSIKFWETNKTNIMAWKSENIILVVNGLVQQNHAYTLLHGSISSTSVSNDLNLFSHLIRAHEALSIKLHF